MNDNFRFYEAFAEVYSRWYASLDPEATVAAWETVLRARDLWPASNGRRLLDVGCGPGAHLAFWSARDWLADGLDSSPRMLRQARRRAEIPAGTELYCADIRDAAALAPLRGRYDLVLAHFNFLNQFEAQELPKVLRNLGALSSPKGLVMTDLTWTLAIDALPLPAGPGPDDWTLEATQAEPGQLSRRWAQRGMHWTERLFVHAPESVARAARLAGLNLEASLPFLGNFGPSGEGVEGLQHLLLVFQQELCGRLGDEGCQAAR